MPTRDLCAMITCAKALRMYLCCIPSSSELSNADGDHQQDTHHSAHSSPNIASESEGIDECASVYRCSCLSSFRYAATVVTTTGPGVDSQDIGTSSCEIDSCDIGSYMKVKNNTDSAKFQLLTCHFKPGPSYSFPCFATGRTVQHKWLYQFQPWLVYYSEVAKGGFCLPCALFANVAPL